MTKDAVHPFLTAVASPTRPFAAALPQTVTRPVVSPWTPAAPAAPPPVEPPVQGPSEAEIAEIFEDARERGRDEGLAQTAALRDRLGALVVELATARAAIVAPAAELIAEVATCVIEAWTEHTRRGDTFGPLIREWIELSSGQPAEIRVHPGDVDTMTQAVGEAALRVVADKTLAPGAVEIRGATLELHHDWRSRLPELRTAIASALTSAAEPEAT